MNLYLILTIIIFLIDLIVCDKLPNKNIQSGTNLNVTKTRKIAARIIGGNFVTSKQQESYNYQVRLLIKSHQRKGEVGSCGGSLIAPNWVLTAAHCLSDVDMTAAATKLYFGITNLLDLSKAQYRLVTENDFIIHQDWNPESILSLHDIALIRLKDPIQITNKVGVLRLPSKKETCLSNEGKIVTVSGWGISDDNGETENNILKSAQVQVATYRECRKTWGDGMNPNLMICSSAANFEGTCEGDSGGPMVLTNNNGEKTLIGVTSFGMDKCNTDDHRIFTCVYAHKKWIEDETGLTFE